VRRRGVRTTAHSSSTGQWCSPAASSAWPRVDRPATVDLLLTRTLRSSACQPRRHSSRWQPASHRGRPDPRVRVGERREQRQQWQDDPRTRPSPLRLTGDRSWALLGGAMEPTSSKTPGQP
jgi:hypothetical protein